MLIVYNTTQQKFPNSSFKDLSLTIHILWGKQKVSKDEQIVLHILTPYSLKSIDKWQRYGHFNACGSGFKNDTLAY